MSYPGGKGASGVVQTIINQQPPHDVYIEPFLGGGSVMRAKRPAARNIGIDLDEKTIADFREAGSSGIELFCTSGIDWLDRRFRSWTGRELVYCDPPYLMETRKNWARMYRFEMSDIAHARLLQTLALLPCMVQISGYESRMYSAHLSGWRCVKYQAATRHGVRTECLWMNYPEPAVLHDFRFLGKDYRERERIRRKAHRWVAKLQALPRLERLAIYGEMASTIANSNGATAPKSLDRADAGDIANFDGGGRHVSANLAVRAIGDRISPEAGVLE
jgi:hypothetical protein